LWACLGQLPQRDQRLLRVLVATDQPSYPAVAAALAMPIGSIGPARLPALTRLRRLLVKSVDTVRERADGSGP
jgi:hypothetical protein